MMLFGKTNLYRSVALLALTFCLSTPDAYAALEDKQLMEINQTLKSAIEENQSLAAEKRQLQSELERLRQDQAAFRRQYEDLKRERDNLAQGVDQARAQNRKYAQELSRMEENIKTLESTRKENDQKVRRLQEELSLQDTRSAGQTIVLASNSTSSEVDVEVKEKESKTLDLLTKIDAFAEEDERLRTDAAKAHYNMGNIYFEKGEYEIAAREYYQAVTLMPDDPDAHYNLALVSDQYLKDPRTALKHYQMYLYLNPNAKDAYWVKERIIGAKLHIRSTIDSPLDKKSK